MLHWSGAGASGVFHKIVGQVSEWLRHGNRVRLSILSSADTADAWRSALPDALIDVGVYRGAWQRLAVPARLVDAAVDWRPDVIYIRTMPWLPALDRLRRAAPMIAEINSSERAEARLRDGVRGRMAYLLRRLLVRRASGTVAVAGGLDGAGTAAPSVTIPNGVDLDALPVLPPAPAGERRVLMLVGENQPWQGVDLLLPMVEHDRELSADVVGPVGPSTGAPVHERIRYHGPMKREEWYPIAERATAGVGTLALFRKGMSSVAPLKHREYLALGLPLVLACSDPDVPRHAPWALHLDNNEWGTTLGAPSVSAFLDRWTGSRVSRADIAHIDTREKESARLQFMEGIIRRGDTA